VSVSKYNSIIAHLFYFFFVRWLRQGVVWRFGPMERRLPGGIRAQEFGRNDHWWGIGAILTIFLPKILHRTH
jgi:uncharacterized SAM-binding protein YcdF (DUF218 family)